MRKKAGEDLQIGELLISEVGAKKILLQVTDLYYSSQINPKHLEFISGMDIENNEKVEFFEPEMRNYELASLKPMLTISASEAKLSKSLPGFFGKTREVKEEDLPFLSQGNMFLGKLRSGNKILEVPIKLDADKVLSHHILITGTTGKGKSVLMTNLLWSAAESKNGVLVLDPHDEYYGKNSLGLKDFEGTEYYSSRNTVVGGKTLRLLLHDLRPDHFLALNFSPAQNQAMNAYYKEYGTNWIEAVILEKPLKVDFNEQSTNVLKRRIMQVLDLNFEDSTLICNGIFSLNAGSTTISNICNALEEGRIVIVDTSQFSGQAELLLGSVITGEVFRRYKQHKIKGTLESKPVISIALEEAPRVLGKNVLETGGNVFSSIAREGRKFKVGIIAITQLPSLIPREILANMNTKIILGTEMSNERQALIDSAAQDLSKDSRNIAALDKGEAIISSNFARFAIPLKVLMLKDRIKNNEKEIKQQVFRGLKD